MIQIESVKNERIKQYAKLKDKKHRDEAGQFLIEGDHLVGEAIQHGLVDILFYVGNNPCSFSGESISVSQPVMDKLSVNVSQVKLIAVCHMKKGLEAKREVTRQRVILLDDVQDPGNVGTIIRTALSFGFDQVILSSQSVDLYNEKVIRSTQGALFQMPVERGDIHAYIEELKEEGFVIYGTAFEQAMPLSEVAGREKMAFVMGNEGKGVSNAVLDQCDARVFIEMSRFDSLNVAIASGILMYQFREKESWPSK